MTTSLQRLVAKFSAASNEGYVVVDDDQRAAAEPCREVIDFVWIVDLAGLSTPDAYRPAEWVAYLLAQLKLTRMT